jgi:hypothetical protein
VSEFYNFSFQDFSVGFACPLDMRSLMEGRRALGLAIVLSFVVALVCVASLMRSSPVVLDDDFPDPINRGVYGPFVPQIRRDPSRGFLQRHVLSGNEDFSPRRSVELARPRSPAGMRQ